MQELGISADDCRNTAGTRAPRCWSSFDEVLQELHQRAHQRAQRRRRADEPAQPGAGAAALDEREQRVVQMYYEFDLSLKEIAAVLGPHRRARLPDQQERAAEDEDLPARRVTDHAGRQTPCNQSSVSPSSLAASSAASCMHGGELQRHLAAGRTADHRRRRRWARIVLGNPKHVLGEMVLQLQQGRHRRKQSQEFQRQLLLLMYELLQTAAGGLKALDAHVEAPHESAAVPALSAGAGRAQAAALHRRQLPPDGDGQDQRPRTRRRARAGARSDPRGAEPAVQVAAQDRRGDARLRHPGRGAGHRDGDELGRRRRQLRPRSPRRWPRRWSAPSSASSSATACSTR